MLKLDTSDSSGHKSARTCKRPASKGSSLPSTVIKRHPRLPRCHQQPSSILPPPHRYPSAFLPRVLPAINSHHSSSKSVSAPTNRPINHSHQHRPRPVPTSPSLPSTPPNNVSPCSHAYSSHQIPPPGAHPPSLHLPRPSYTPKHIPIPLYNLLQARKAIIHIISPPQDYRSLPPSIYKPI